MFEILLRERETKTKQKILRDIFCHYHHDVVEK